MSEILEAIFQRRAIRVLAPIEIPGGGAGTDSGCGAGGSFEL